MRTSRTVLGILGFFALGAPGVGWAHGGHTSLVHACASVPRGGQGSLLRLVAPADSCRPGETAVDWPGSIGDQPPTQPRFVVRDANGAEVGRFAGMRLLTNPEVHVTALERTMTFLVRRTRLSSFQADILFDGASCAGNAYTSSVLEEEALLKMALAITRDASPGPLVYATQPGGGTPQDVNIVSSLPAQTGDCNNTPQGLRSVVPLDIFSLNFVPPFSAEYE